MSLFSLQLLLLLQSAFHNKLVNLNHHFLEIYLEPILFLLFFFLVLYFVPLGPAKCYRVRSAHTVESSLFIWELLEIVASDLVVLQTHDVSYKIHVTCPCWHRFLKKSFLFYCVLNLEKNPVKSR